MSPVLRAKSSLSPLATRGAWLTGGAVASLALVFAGVATPASASVTPAADSVVAGPANEDCKKENGHHEKYQPEGKAQTPGGPLHEQCEDRDRDEQECSDIDSATMGNREVSAVLTDGNVFAGDRTFNGQGVGDYEWEEISDNRNFPKNACSVSVSLADNDAWVKVLTTQGTVYETHGDRSGSDFEWDERWRKLTDQPGEDDEVTSTREKGELVAPVQPNS